MAPNLKKISVLTLDLPELQLLSERTKAADVPPPVEDVSASYWEWNTGPPAPSSSSVQDFDDDLFSVEHIQSNLIQASQFFSKAPPVLSPTPATPEYWAEHHEETSAERLSHQPLHHPPHHTTDLVASDMYWKDSHERSERDLYWSEVGSVATRSIQVPPKQPRSVRQHTIQDCPIASATLYRNATPQQHEESHRYWFWGHPESDSDRYWLFDGTSTPAPMVSAV